MLLAVTLHFVYFLQELPAVFAQLHGLMAAHSHMFARLLPAEEAVLSDILSEVLIQSKFENKRSLLLFA